MTQPTFLVTGGTGLVGGAIVESLGEVPIVSLSRSGADGERRSASAAGLLPGSHGHVGQVRARTDSARHVIGDVTREGFGMAKEDYEALAASVDVVIHCAGVTDFTTHRKIMGRTHVDGTRNAVAFAERAGAPLYHVSTAYVEANGTSVRGRWGAEIYIKTKREAEEIVGASDSLAAIIRPSIVWGNSDDGWTPSFQGLHRLIGMMLENKLPLFPFGPETCVDFLPREVVGSVIADLARGGFQGEYWLTAGDRAVAFGRIVELLLDFGAELGRELQPPRFVTTEMIDRLIRPAAGETHVRRVDLMLALTSHFSSQPRLPSSLPDADKPDLEAAFLRGAAFWLEENTETETETEERVA